MKIKYFMVAALVCLSLRGQENNLYMPINIKKAYESGTRSEDGRPGENYWQNRSEYTITVKLDPASKILSGEERVKYFNNSPDPLTHLIIRLYPDIYKYGNSRDFGVDPSLLHNGVNITRLSADGVNIDPESGEAVSRGAGTNLRLKLPETLNSGESTELFIGWNYKFPHIRAVRMGTYNDSSFFAAYWYPQIAVYDDIDGWDQFDYGGQVEFYNDFSDFDVKIIMPQNYIVWATGLLQNPEEVLEKKFLERYLNGIESDKIVNVITAEDLNLKRTPGAGDLIWHYKARNVPDFAFATSSSYLWDLTSLTVEDHRERVIIDAAYNPESKDFYEVAEISRKTVKFFSEEMPGYPFPYPAVTVFNGSGGMEFPMMVNDGTTATKAETVGLTSHEIAHTYFPFYMGTNERKYAWMDEGWAEFLPYEFQTREAEDNFPREKDVYSYASFAGREMEVPLMIPSILLGERNSYREQAYGRSAAAYQMLYGLMGDELFREALNEFIGRWNGKHPIPYDFFFTFNDVYGEDLSWFWKPWFFESGYPDLTFGSVDLDEDIKRVEIINKGNLPVPVKLVVIYNDQSFEIICRSISEWQNNPDGIGIEFETKKEIIKLELGSPVIPDADPENNSVAIN